WSDRAAVIPNAWQGGKSPRCIPPSQRSPLRKKHPLEGQAVGKNVAALVQNRFDFEAVCRPAALQCCEHGRLDQKPALFADAHTAIGSRRRGHGAAGWTHTALSRTDTGYL